MGADSTTRAAPAVALLAGAWTAIAAFASFGAVAFDGASGPRIGVVPSDGVHLALAVAAGLIVAGLGWRRARPAAVAVSPLVVVFLPWLPFRVPPAFLIWTGPLASLAWITAAIALAVTFVPVFVSESGPVIGRAIGSPRRSAMIAGLLSFVLFGMAAWLASPALPAGDEPHYLVVTQSLLYDHDLKIENNHQRGDYRAYFTGDLLPHYVRRGRNGAIYSIHAPGLPAIVLPAFALGGYRGVVLFLLFVSAAACGLAWWLAWRVTNDCGAAWFGWAAVSLSAPFLLESYTVFPDGPGAAVVLTGVWALLRADWEREKHEGHEGHEGRAGDGAISSFLPWFLHGLALALLPWMHTRFVVIAATLGGLVLVRLAHAPNPLSKAVAFLTAPAASALAWLFFFVLVYGVPDPTAPYGGDTQNSFSYLADGLGGLLFDQGYGLFAAAPVLVLAFAGFARAKRLGLEWVVIAVPYLLAVTTYPMWWAGTSGPARFLVPMLLPLAIPAACLWKAAVSRGARTLMAAALVVSLWVAFVMAGAGGGRLGYHSRNESGPTAAPWMEWANPVVDLPAAFPAFVPLPGGTPLAARTNAAASGFATLLPWAFCLGLAAWLIVWFGGAPRPPEAAIAVSALALACATMIASTLVWIVRGGAPTTVVESQIHALGTAASRAIAFDLSDRERLDLAAVRTMAIESPVRRPVRGGPRLPNRPLASFPRLPAGSYELSVKRLGAGDGWIMAGVGNDQFALVTQPIAAFDGGARVDLPVDVRTLSVRAEEAGRDQLEAVVLKAVSLPPDKPRREVAWRAVRYGDADAFFVDDRAYPEPSGFWVMGGRETEVFIAPDRPRAAMALHLRNGAAANTVTIACGDWTNVLALAPGEERRVDVPLAPQSSARIRIRSAATFRPSEVDPASRDTRLLGVFVVPEKTE